MREYKNRGVGYQDKSNDEFHENRKFIERNFKKIGFPSQSIIRYAQNKSAPQGSQSLTADIISTEHYDS